MPPQNFLRIIKQFSNHDFEEFLQENELSEFIDIFMKGGITNGEQFLDLNELQMVRWHLPAPDRKKIFSVLSQIKENPEKCLTYNFTKKRPARPQSIMLEKQNSFLDRLEKLIITPPLKESNKEIIESELYPPKDFDDELYLEPNNTCTPGEMNINLKISFNHTIANRPPMILPEKSCDSGESMMKTICEKGAIKAATNTPPEDNSGSDNEIYEAVNNCDENPAVVKVNVRGRVPLNKSSHWSKLFKRKTSAPPVVNEDDMIEIRKKLSHENISGSVDCLQKKIRPLPPLPSNEDIVVLRKSVSIEKMSTDGEILSDYINMDDCPKLRNNYTNNEGSSSKYEKFRSSQTLPDVAPLPRPPPQLSMQRSEKLAEDNTYGQYKHNCNDEPFFRNTDATGAKLLLTDLPDGAFLFRPSKQFDLAISIKYRGAVTNLGIERTNDRKLRLDTIDDNMSPEFSTLTEFVKYFTRYPLTFQRQNQIVDVLLAEVLPNNRF